VRVERVRSVHHSSGTGRRGPRSVEQLRPHEQRKASTSSSRQSKASSATSRSITPRRNTGVAPTVASS
jgi:hypothetical protein